MAKTIQTSRKRALAPVKTKANARAKPPAKAKAQSTKATVKATAPEPKRRALTVHLTKGDWIDVLDNEGTWNVAQVIRLASTKEVEVKYDGWGEEYNEVVAINTGRIAPFHTFTWTVKCWAKYDNWPWWPSVVTFRPPGTLAGQEYLTNETRMFVDFLDNKDIAKRCRCWVERVKIKPFNNLEDRLRGATDSPAFEASFTRVLQSKASVDFAPLGKRGTLPVEYKNKLTLPVKEITAEMGSRQWIEQMNSSKVRHGGIYSYQPKAIEEDLGFDDDDIYEDAYADLGENDWRVDPEKTSSKRRSNAPPKQKKTASTTSSKRLVLKAETKREAGSPLPPGEGQVLDGPHVPSPKREDEEEIASIPDEQSSSDVAHTSDEDERVSRLGKRLRVLRKREVSSTPEAAIEVSVQRNNVKRSSKNARAPASPIHLEEETRMGENETPPAEDLEVVREESEKELEVTVSSLAMTTGEEDSEEIPIEIVLPSDEDTSQQDTPEDLGVVDDMDEELAGEARGDEEETNANDMKGDTIAEIVSVVDDEPVQSAVEDHGERDDEEVEDDDVGDDEEDKLLFDPLDDWGATRSSGVEGFIEPGSSNPPTSPLVREEQSPVEASVRSADEIAVAIPAGVPEDGVRDDVVPVENTTVSPEVASLMPEAKRQTTGSKRKSTKLLADAERAALLLLQETDEQGVVAQKKSRLGTGEILSKSGGSKTSKAAKKTPAKQRTGKAPVGNTLSKKAATPFSDRLANENSPNGSGNKTQQMTSLQAATNGPGVAREVRPSVRARAAGHTEKLQGKTPVFVNPPPKFESHTDVSSPTSSSSDISVVPTSPQIASHLTFRSSSPFTMGRFASCALLNEDLDPWNASEEDELGVGETGEVHDLTMSCPSEDDGGYDGDDHGHRPMYTTRHPPLVQPLRLSHFSENARTKCAAQDLAHEWVALFQAIGSGGSLEHRHGVGPSSQRPMKMHMLDTVLMSPTGQPSLWYRTTASKHIKAHQLASVTPRAILKAFRLQDPDAPCALVRRGFKTLVLNGSQLKKLCEEMEYACIRGSPANREELPDDSSEEGDEGNWDDDENDQVSESGVSDDRRSTRAFASTTLIEDTKPMAFCVQKYVASAQNVGFLCLWKRVAVEKSQPRRRSSSTTLSSPDCKPLAKAIDEIYLLQSQLPGEANIPLSSEERVDDAPEITLQKLAFGETEDVRTRKQLSELGFDAEATLPLLLQMKLLTAEMASRINRACGSSRQITRLACEFILSASTGSPSKPTPHANTLLSVVFVALAGIEWHGHSASWDALRDVDPVSKAIFDCCSGVQDCDRERDRLSKKRSDAVALSRRPDLSLALFDELNPRFPSVQSPLVGEKQWKNKSALLPPYVSPRYIGAEMPKQYRGGQFSPLLSPRQSDSVNRLNIFSTEPSPYSPRHPLSEKYADVERELWMRREVEEGIAVFMPRSPINLGSPRRVSPRHRHSLIKEELV